VLRLRARRLFACCLLAALVAAPGAQGAVVFRGFSKNREAALRADLSRSLLPYGALVDAIVRPRDLPPGALGLAGSNGTVYLDPSVFRDARVRAFALLHELAHHIDFQVLTVAERGRYYEAGGFGSPDRVSGFDDPDWYDGSLRRDLIPAEQWASAVPLVAWPAARGNPFLGADGSCIGWEAGEGCAAPLDVVREILNSVLARRGLAPLGADSTPAAPPAAELFVPPRVEAPAERTLRPPDPGATPIATSLVAGTGLKASPKRASVVRVRLDGPGGPLPGVTVVLDYRDATGWWQLAELQTDAAGEISYRFRPKGWKPLAFRVTFGGLASLTGSTLVVPVAYAR
jgi:hypothetical protein